MSPFIENEFYATFPELFRGRFKSRDESAMAFGLDCGDEYRQLLWVHCQALERAALDNGLLRTDARWPEILQVKEKAGTLRVYVANETASMRALRDQLLMDSANGDTNLL
jgi:hypothetical protein